MSVETQKPPRGINGLFTDIYPPRRPLRDDPCGTTDCRLSGSLRQAPRRDVRPPAREFRWWRCASQGGRARVWVGGGFRPLPGGPAGAWEDPAHATELLGQRIFGIACGHPDGNDANRLADDPIHKLLLGREPVAGEALASQPTISRFENGVGPSALYALGRELAMRVIERHQRRLDGRARWITIDLDPTDDATHGAQQLTFFNGHYDSWCYLPLLVFLTFDQEREQYLCAAVLRPGNVPATRGTLSVLCRLLPLLRQAFPRARFLVRLDGGFATPEIFDYLDAEPRLDYVVAMAKNAVLQRHAEPALIVAQAQSAASGQTAHVYADTRYRARTWARDRRVVIKAEVVRLGDREPRDNPRFVVTNLRQTPRFLYEKVHCARGDIENRIKELRAGSTPPTGNDVDVQAMT